MGDGGFSTVERCCERRENNFAQFKKMCIFAVININPKPTSDEAYSIVRNTIRREVGAIFHLNSISARQSFETKSVKLLLPLFQMHFGGGTMRIGISR